MPSDIGKLVTSAALANSSETFIFEPRDFVPFKTAWSWQRDWQKSLFSNPFGSEAVWLLQHSNCYTLGRGKSSENLLFDIKNPPAEFLCVDRGGDVTHHLPGQLVVYLVLDLRRHRTDLNWYLRQLEQVLIDVLNEFDLRGTRIPGFTGLWVEGIKVAAIGVGCRRWVTQHGFALNVNCDLSGFDEIVPCGLRGRAVGKLNDWLPGLMVSDVQPVMRSCLGNRFGFDWCLHQ